MHSNKKFIARDLAVLWHPCTQMKDHETLPIIPIKTAKGVWLEDFEGNRYLDAISSWWVNLFGHSNTYINQAIHQQVQSLEHVLLAGFTHEPVVTLSERLVAATPDGLNKCFYADNGSSAIEVALKMSFHYFLNKNIGTKNKQNKTRFVSLTNSYHGETIGALSVGDVELYKKTYQPLLLDVITVPSPDCYTREEGESWESHSRKMFAHMEHTLSQSAHEICAVVIEPLVQCAGNMRMYHPVYLQLLRAACDKYDILLIADEIAVGFGRTGTMFACEQANITPDLMCLSKGITAGYMPLSVVLTTNTLYDAFYDDYENLTAFLHSHSYTGNPIACAIALATFDIFDRENIITNNQKLITALQQQLQRFENHPKIGEVRQTGMIAAIEMVKDKKSKTPYPWQERRGLKVYQYALKHGVLLRPLGNVIYFMPPYVITEEQIKTMVDVAEQGIHLATKD